jgi:hypothetical protein
MDLGKITPIPIVATNTNVNKKYFCLLKINPRQVLFTLTIPHVIPSNKREY